MAALMAVLEEPVLPAGASPCHPMNKPGKRWLRDTARRPSAAWARTPHGCDGICAFT